MVGFDEYIKKHGRHFTLELAYAVTGNKYKADYIDGIISKMVWYNVTGSTFGDIVYGIDVLYKYYAPVHNIIGVCQRVVDMVGDMDNTCFAFNYWIAKAENNNFDFTPYI